MAVKDQLGRSTSRRHEKVIRAAGRADLRQRLFERRFLVLVLIAWFPLVVILAGLGYFEYSTGVRDLTTFVFADILAKKSSAVLMRLLGVMTTVSYSALLIAGVCAGLISYSCNYIPGTAKGKVVWGAIAVLLFLAALDERFVFHEEAGKQLGMNDALIVALYPAAVLALAVWRRSELLRFRRNSWLLYIVAAALLTSIVVDYFYIFDKRYAYMTLAEDGAKVFASVSLCLLILKCLLDQLRLPYETQSSVSV